MGLRPPVIRRANMVLVRVIRSVLVSSWLRLKLRAVSVSLIRVKLVGRLSVPVRWPKLPLDLFYDE